MCCGGPADGRVPTAVAEMLVEYRRLAGADWLWGESPTHSMAALLSQLRFVALAELIGEAVSRAWSARPGAPFQEVLEAALAEDPDDLLRAALAGRTPAGLLRLKVSDAGVQLAPGTARPIASGSSVEFSLLVDSDRSRPVELRWPGGTRSIPPRGAALVDLRWDDPAGCGLALDGHGRAVDLELRRAFVATRPGRLRVRAPHPLRWSVVDAAGGAWFPQGALRKWDVHHRPFFHAAEAELEVPSASFSVTAARGLEYHVETVTTEVPPGGEAAVELDPSARIDPGGRGWFGGDLHVHMNYAGDEVCTPEQAVAMQVGEGLHLVNLVAGNCTTSRVFDRAALEAWAGDDLPWSTPGSVARMGVEYRNDLLGHFHALGPARPPSRYHSGHAGSDADEDWPANAVAAAEARRLGATVGYCHPVLLPIEEDPSLVFELQPRSVEAREVVVDAALGLVDSLDVLSNMSGRGAGVLYRKLVAAGLRLAVTAGTDCFLSFSRCGTFSNPPGWARSYARVEGPLGVESYQEAVRAGRTVATNGPWIELQVDGAGPGDRLDARRGQELEVEARVVGPGAERLRILAAEGEVASTPVTGGATVLRSGLVVDEPSFLVAEATGGPHPEVLDHETYAHTSACYVDVAGRGVARPDAAAWCLDWIDRLEGLVRRHGVFHRPDHLDEVLATFDEARAVYRQVAEASGTFRA